MEIYNELWRNFQYITLLETQFWQNHFKDLDLDLSLIFLKKNIYLSTTLLILGLAQIISTEWKYFSHNVYVVSIIEFGGEVLV